MTYGLRHTESKLTLNQALEDPEVHDCFCFTPGCEEPSAKPEDYSVRLLLPREDRGKFTLQQLATGVDHKHALPALSWDWRVGQNTLIGAKKLGAGAASQGLLQGVDDDADYIGPLKVNPASLAARGRGFGGALSNEKFSLRLDQEVRYQLFFNRLFGSGSDVHFKLRF